jgi:hypothetical protein
MKRPISTDPNIMLTPYLGGEDAPNYAIFEDASNSKSSFLSNIRDEWYKTAYEVFFTGVNETLARHIPVRKFGLDKLRIEASHIQNYLTSHTHKEHPFVRRLAKNYRIVRETFFDCPVDVTLILFSDNTESPLWHTDNGLVGSTDNGLVGSLEIIITNTFIGGGTLFAHPRPDQIESFNYDGYGHVYDLSPEVEEKRVNTGDFLVITTEKTHGDKALIHATTPGRRLVALFSPCISVGEIPQRFDAATRLVTGAGTTSLVASHNSASVAGPDKAPSKGRKIRLGHHNYGKT